MTGLQILYECSLMRTASSISSWFSAQQRCMKLWIMRSIPSSIICESFLRCRNLQVIRSNHVIFGSLWPLQIAFLDAANLLICLDDYVLSAVKALGRGPAQVYDLILSSWLTATFDDWVNRTLTPLKLDPFIISQKSRNAMSSWICEQLHARLHSIWNLRQKRSSSR